ncbi:MAG TPA: hypothetical protein VK403_10165 [Allosphingosinicella sp.]|nr:hypothetical protein [Allosphingosinicella sp.]
MDEAIQWISDLLSRLRNGLINWSRCVEGNLRIFVTGDFGLMLFGFIGIFFFGLLVVSIIAAASGQWELVGGYIGGMLIFGIVFFGIWFIGGLLAIMATCAATVRLDVVADATAITSGAVGAIIASGAVTGCREAEALLAQARAALEAARSARDRQGQRVTDARGRVRNARGMVYGASASAVAAAWHPWSLAGALAALAAAVTLLARRSREFTEQVSLLAVCEAQLLRALADVAAGETLVAALCGALPTAENGVDPGLLAGGPVPVSPMPTFN